MKIIIKRVIQHSNPIYAKIIYELESDRGQGNITFEIKTKKYYTTILFDDEILNEDSTLMHIFNSLDDALSHSMQALE